MTRLRGSGRAPVTNEARPSLSEPELQAWLSERGGSMTLHDQCDMLRALLGPAGPELTCEQCFEQLDRYVELELAGEKACELVPGMCAHLEGCPPCEEDHLSLRTFVEREIAAT